MEHPKEEKEKIIPLQDSQIEKEIIKPRAMDVDLLAENALIGFDDGSFRVYDLDRESIASTKKEFDSAITVIKMSPDGKSIAIGCAKGTIKVYSYPELQLISTISGHAGSVTHFDWS